MIFKYAPLINERIPEINNHLAINVYDLREILTSPESLQKILDIIQLGLSEYSADKNLPRPLKVTIDITKINIYSLIYEEPPEEYSDTVILNLADEDYLKDILEYIRKYIQDVDEVKLHSRLGSYTEHMKVKDEYSKLIDKILAIFYDKIIHCFIHQIINKTPYLNSFFKRCSWNGAINSKIKDTSDNHQDDGVSLEIDWSPLYGDLVPSLTNGRLLKAILAKDAQTIELREKILKIDEDTFEYIAKDWQQYQPEYL